MRSQAAIVALALASSVSAFWRLPCRSQSGVGRVDPLVDTGVISGHVHTIHGSSGFGFTADYDTLTADGTCTSCEVTQDHSVYWTPTVHFLYSNGTAVMVEQVGGMLAYYLYYLTDVTAFPEGFSMIAGNAEVRNFTGPFPDDPLSSWPTDPSDQFFLQQRSLGFNCLDYSKTPEASLYRHIFPQKEYMDANCIDGLRLELAFPSCWNGETTSDDHKSHVAYPSLVKEGNCPDSHPKHLPFLFFETIWNTYAFAGEDGQFVLSMGDPVGTGYHGDFIMGWESQEFLQNALDTCTDQSGEISACPLFTIQDDTVGAECTFDMPSVLKDDNVKGPRNGLPVDVPIQYGPEQATEYAVAGQSGQKTTSIAATSAPSTFSNMPTVSYSAANASETSTALGGIVEANAKSTASATASSSAAAAITSAPSLAAAASSADIVATSYITNGNEVVELFIEEVDVTVTATPSAAAKHRRHLDRHLHHAGRR